MKTDQNKGGRAAKGGDPDQGERVAKRLARAGMCSRRDAERWIAEGRVAVNGTVLDSPAMVVRPGDVVAVDGNPIPEAEPSRVWRYHKPAGLVTTARDEKGRDTVFDKLPAELPRVVSIGRLDLTTEGLLLLTNDGELARHLELPATGWTRRYRVRVHGVVDEARLANLTRGLEIDGVRYGPIEAALDKVQGSNAWLSVGLKEGKNREIRKVMETLGLQVTRLIRLSYGPFQLGKLPEGEVEEIPRRVLVDQMEGFFGDSAEVEPDPKAKPGAKAAKPAAKRPTLKLATKLAEAKPAISKPGAAKPGAVKSAAAKSERAKPASARPEGRKGPSAKPRPAKPLAEDGRSADFRTGKPNPRKPTQGKPTHGKPTRGESAQTQSAAGAPKRGKPAAAETEGRSANRGRKPMTRTDGDPSAGKPNFGKPSVGRAGAGKAGAGDGAVRRDRATGDRATGGAPKGAGSGAGRGGEGKTGRRTGRRNDGPGGSGGPRRGDDANRRR